MTHYTQDYSDMESPEKEIAAIRDVHYYLNAKQWNALLDGLIGITGEAVSLKRLHFLLGLVGISGYPILALFQTFRPDDYQAWYDSLED